MATDSVGRTSSGERLPIKVVLPSQGVERPVKGGGSRALPFRTVDRAYRTGLVHQVDASRLAVSSSLKTVGVVPLRVKLLPKAIAKSHRPESLFSDRTCPIIGAGAPGELYVKATARGLGALEKAIADGSSARLVKEMSCVEAIEPVTPNERRGGLSAVDILRSCPGDSSGYLTKVRLFSLEGDSDRRRLVDDFEGACDRLGLKRSSSGYSATSCTYAVECRTTADVEAIASVTGVRSIAAMPVVRAVRPQALNPTPRPSLLSRRDVIGDVPVVAVVDSGIASNIAELESWVVGRDSAVAPQYRNIDHGTFVAGLVCWGGELNPQLRGLDSSPCAVFDLQVIPNGDPSKGDVDYLTEPELLEALEKALKAHADEYKVWNLSLGSNALCSLDDFSTCAEELDNLQEKYQVTFVISAGNYDTLPLLGYPRSGSELRVGRITTPADSVLGVAVGSVSHVDYGARGPKENEPAPYSRHGAGPNYVIKPDLVHYGGTCTVDGSHVSGVRSLFGDGCAEDLGTSFAAPLVSRTLAQIYHRVEPMPSPVLARALLTHHARDPRTGQRVPDGEEDFFGFGLPASVPYCLECSPNMATLVFDDVLRPGLDLEWDYFPYPESLTRDSKFFGEVWMTVAFAPSRGARWGSEYCENHVEAHFGVYYDKVNKKTGEITEEWKPLAPPEHKNPGQLWESYQVSALRKWAPVRTYHGRIGPRGTKGNRWRLKVNLLNRHGAEIQAGQYRNQPFALIVTIADPRGLAPVYDEMARVVASRFQTQNLTLRASARIAGTV